MIHILLFVSLFNAFLMFRLLWLDEKVRTLICHKNGELLSNQDISIDKMMLRFWCFDLEKMKI